MSGGATGGAGGAGGCPSDAHETDAGCVATITWAMGPKVPTARNHHETWLVDKGSNVFLYVAGGFDVSTNTLADVQRAPVKPDGTLGAWMMQPPLPAPLGGSGVAMTHGEVILAGGYDSAATWLSVIQPDGSMGTWNKGPALPAISFHTTAVAYQDFVYVIGGLNDTTQSESATVVRSTVAADGSLGPWQMMTALPQGLSHHAAVVFANKIFVIGGETTFNTIAVATVLSTTIAADGSLGSWQTEAPLPLIDETQSAFVHDGWLYVVGGIGTASTVTLRNVFRAPLAPDGTLGAWVDDTASRLPHARCHVHQTPVYQRWVYSVAGAPTGFPTVTDEADVGTFH
jgi:N-acetylneuraminic acid mutarotase